MTEIAFIIASYSVAYAVFLVYTSNIVIYAAIQSECNAVILIISAAERRRK